MDTEYNLFNQKVNERAKVVTGPLAFRFRPQIFQDFIGINELIKKYPFLNGDNLSSMVFFGPPGTGKTTLASLLASNSGSIFHSFSAVLGNVNELKKLMDEAYSEKRYSGKNSIIFVDEIHRFNKAQQDALLPRVESGDFTLIGATTENPKFVLNSALLSRVHLVELQKISEENLNQILKNGVRKLEGINFPEEFFETVLNFSDGDARRALNLLEVFIKMYPQGFQKEEWEKKEKEFKGIIGQHGRDYDRKYNRHYDVISAFIKSMRGSDPDSAVLWLAVMLDGGEDPLFIARRLVIFASEDVGNADPWGLTIATSALEGVKSIGMPESRIILAQATTYLASTIKSNASYLAIDEALAYVRSQSTLEVPDHLKNNSKQYKYPHDYPHHFVKQSYTKEELPKFYRPSNEGRERLFNDRLNDLWNFRRNS